MEKIVLLGCGGHAKSVIDTVERGGLFEIAGLVDKEPGSAYEYKGYRIIGADEDLKQIYDSGVRHAFVTVGFMGKGRIRNRLYDQLKEIGYQIPCLIDQTAVIADNAVIGEGTYVGKCAVVNADVRVGKMCIINTGAIIEHECTVGNYSHVSVGSVLCGGVRTEEECFVGAGAVVIQGIRLGQNCIVGAGTTIRKDIPPFYTMVGGAARVISRQGDKQK